MAPKAIISDIHSNLEAWQAVLKDIKSKNISEIICLGDIIGYGPNPCECLQLAMANISFCIRGNHEDALLSQSIDFHKDAAEAINWTREQLNSPTYTEADRKNFWVYLEQLPRLHEENHHLLLHGSPCDPTREYLQPEDIYSKIKIQSNFDLIKNICFCGHTHKPGIFRLKNNNKVDFLTPEEINYTYEITDKKYIINVGAVGQSRDGDNRASYIILEEKRINYFRIPYDYRKTMKKIIGTKRLPLAFAKRLEVGR